ncbi:hypothetical protein N5079_19790 [Planotetraspora sp. A-T 1434]|uniref:hypothetical protein n=1 Tax=Planotetraspora sp. A-T 1434 TaxID=2979219 RepID=UPI0021BF918B|nr:hypothetical protein [Planotetraspora sp. A-T 1434]MCT9932447.1 hypothetical protein [Planotetraspora sp. A-T 1434]
MPPIPTTPDELLLTVRELFPLQYHVAELTLINRRQAEMLHERDEQLAQLTRPPAAPEPEGRPQPGGEETRS